jgi:hypothetical protein
VFFRDLVIGQRFGWLGRKWNAMRGSGPRRSGADGGTARRRNGAAEQVSPDGDIGTRKTSQENR